MNPAEKKYDPAEMVEVSLTAEAPIYPRPSITMRLGDVLRALFQKFRDVDWDKVPDVAPKRLVYRHPFMHPTRDFLVTAELVVRRPEDDDDEDPDYEELRPRIERVRLHSPTLASLLRGLDERLGRMVLSEIEVLAQGRSEEEARRWEDGLLREALAVAEWILRHGHLENHGHRREDGGGGCAACAVLHPLLVRFGLHGEAPVFSTDCHCDVCRGREARVLAGRPAMVNRAPITSALAAAQARVTELEALLGRCPINPGGRCIHEHAQDQRIERLEKAIEGGGFQVANNAAHPFLGPTPEDKPTLWCKECGRDSGYHRDTCSKRSG